MSTTADPNDPLHVPSRVAIETLQGDIRAGEVITTEYEASAAAGIERWFTVDVDGSTFRRPASEVGTATDAP